MGRITVYDNPFEQCSPRTTEFCGLLLSFLREEYPNGFPGNHRLYLNGSLIAPDKYEFVELGASDEIRLYLMPGLPAAATIGAYIATALITAAVSVALNFVFSKLFPTKAQKLSSASSETPAAESVYSLTSPSNVPALGAPVPVIYGRVLTTPKLASIPYSWYRYNQQYVDILLCLGHGQFDIHEIQIAGSPIQQMPAGVVQYRVHNSSSHGQGMGNIEVQWNDHFFENVDTTPEVSDQELIQAERATGKGTIQANGTLLLASPLDGRVAIGRSTSTNATRLNNGTRTITAISADRLTITFDQPLEKIRVETAAIEVSYFYTYDPAPGSSTLTVGWTWPAFDPVYNPPGSGFIVSSYTDTVLLNLMGGTTATFLSKNSDIYATSATFEGDLDDGTLIDSQSTAVNSIVVKLEEIDYPFSFDTQNNTVGPFMACRPGENLRHIELDFILPNGLYTVNEENGALHNAWVEYSIILTQVDDNGDPTGAPQIMVATSYVAATNTPIRFSYFLNVGSGRWTAQVRRTNQKSSRAVDQSNFYWAGLKGVLHLSPSPTYGDVTLISMRVKATDGIASDALNKIGVDCTRLLPNGKPSENPAVIYEDIVTNTVYGAARSSSELDTQALADLQAWDSGFNGIFDFSGQVWDSITTVLKPFRARPLPLGPVFSVVIDRPTSAVARFTDANEDQTGAIVLDSMQFGWQYAEENEPDGFEIEYRDPKDWIARYVRYPADSVNPLTENLMGCTDPVQALARAKYLWNLREYRQEFLKFEVELEGHLVQIGDRITVDHSMVEDDYVVSSIRIVDSHRVEIESYKYDTRVWS
jgi:hypothetical protein